MNEVSSFADVTKSGDASLFAVPVAQLVQVLILLETNPNRPLILHRKITSMDNTTHRRILWPLRQRQLIVNRFPNPKRPTNKSTKQKE